MYIENVTKWRFFSRAAICMSVGVCVCVTWSESYDSVRKKKSLHANE